MSDRPIYFRQINQIEVAVRNKPGGSGNADLMIRFAKRVAGAKPVSSFAMSDLSTLLLLIQDVQLMFQPLLVTSDGEDFDDLCL